VSFCRGHSVQLDSFAISVCTLMAYIFSINLHNKTVVAITGSTGSLVDSSMEQRSSFEGLNVKLLDRLKPIAMLLKS
jgi:hypothetical protein